MNQPATIFAISDLAREFGITPRTIRFWEDQGILSPEREGSKRIFTRRDRARLKMALRGKRLGLSLADIKDLIGMYESTEDETPQLLECLRVMSRRREALEQQREGRRIGPRQGRADAAGRAGDQDVLRRRPRLAHLRHVTRTAARASRRRTCITGATCWARRAM